MSGARRRAASLASAACVAWACGCAAQTDAGGSLEHRVEFIYERHGGLCATPDGGGLCRLRVEVHDDGRWIATGTPSPAASGTVREGAASELAAMFEDGFEALTARPFTDVCPTAYDGSEVAYTVRRIPTGPDAHLADAAVSEARSCLYDFSHSGARAVLDDLAALWRELGLPD